ncbi:hypothetical protein II941_01125 [bacterium]|nr:hypothetical protein [bacterium]
MKLIASACIPTRITGVEIVDNDQKIATVIVPNDYYSAIIGQQGANVRLISQLTGWSIDVKKEDEAFAENLDFVPINPSFYERRRNNLNPLPQFASADETLRNIEKSKVAVENFLGIKDNQIVDNAKNNEPQPIKEPINEAPVESTSVSNESLAPVSTNSESKAKEILVKTPVKEKSVNNKMSKTSTKIDYDMLKASSNAQNINSIESILESSDSTSSTKKSKKTTKKSKFSKTNSLSKQPSKDEKKKNILEEFTDITKEYLEDDEDVDNNNDLDEEFDDTDYDK